MKIHIKAENKEQEAYNSGINQGWKDGYADGLSDGKRQLFASKDLKTKCDHKFSPPFNKKGDALVGEIWGDFEVVAINPEVPCFAVYKCKKCGYLMNG